MSTATELRIEHETGSRKNHVKVIAHLGDRVVDYEEMNLAIPEKRQQFARRLNNKFPAATVEIIEELLLQIVSRGRRPDEPLPGDSQSAPDSACHLAGMSETARAEGRVLLESSDMLDKILGDIEIMGVAGEKELAMLMYLVGTSRLLDRPLSAIITGHSSSGKSYVPERVSCLFPTEAILRATQQTPQSLFYLDPGSLKHRFVIGGERSRAESDETAEATRALREMIASGRLSKLVAMKINGKMQTVLIEQEGPIAYVESTTAGRIFEEDANRCLLLTTDERKEQTRLIVEKFGARAAGESHAGDRERIIERHFAAQRILSRMPIVIPYAAKLAESFGSDRVEARRAFPMLVSTIEASALLHQLQRQVDADGRVVANEDDYQLARHLLIKPFARQLGGGVSDSATRLLDRLEKFSDAEFTTTEAADTCHAEFNSRSVRNWLTELHDAGCLEQTDAPRGNKPARWRATGRAPGDANCGALPPAEKLFASSE